MDSKGKLNLPTLALLVALTAIFVILATASLNNLIPTQVLPVNSSSELDLSAYFPEFPDNVWFSASGTGNLSVLFGSSLSEPWKFYRSSDVTIVPSRDWVGEETIEFKATDGVETVKKSVLVRVVPSTTTTTIPIISITTTSLINLIERTSGIITQAISTKATQPSPTPAGKIATSAISVQSGTASGIRFHTLQNYSSEADNLTDSVIRRPDQTNWACTEKNCTFYMFVDNDNLTAKSSFFTVRSFRNGTVWYNSTDGWRNLSELGQIGQGSWNYSSNSTDTSIAYGLAGSDGYDYGIRDSLAGGSYWLDSSGNSLDSGLVLDLHFEENSGNKTYDASGYNNTGTCYGVTGQVCNWTSGRFGGALQFDGVNDYVDAGNGASLNITNAITASAWIKPGIQISPSSGRTAIISYQNGEVRLWLDTNNQVYLEVYNSSGGQQLSQYVTIALNQWHYVTGTYNGNSINIYVDGAEYAGSSLGAIRPITTNLRIGHNNQGTGDRYFNGTIDEVRIYNRALSAQEIKQMYEQTKLKFSNDFLTASFGDSVNVSDYQGQGLYQLFTPSLKFDGMPIYYTYQNPNRALYYYDWQDMEYKILRQGGEAEHRKGLVLDMRFDENSGNKTYDGSGYNNTGTCYGVGGQVCNWTTGKFGTGLQFDGVDDYVQKSSMTNIISGSNSFTYSTWVKFTSTSTNMNIVGISTGGGGSLNGAHLGINLAGKAAYNDGEANYNFNTGGINNGQWHQVAVVRNATNLVFYLDGVADGSSAYIKTLTSNTVNVYAGYSPNFMGYFNGTIDEVRIYNRALTEDEIRVEYINGRAKHGMPDWNDPRYKQEFKLMQQFKKDFYPEITQTYLFTAHDPFVRVFTDTSQKSGELSSSEANDSTLVGYWKLNSVNSSNNTLDSSRYGNNGQFITSGTPATPSSSLVAGKFGNALQFDGVDDYVDYGISNAINSATDHTIELWVNLRSTVSHPAILLANNGAWKGFTLEIPASGSTLQFGNGNGVNDWQMLGSISSLSFNKWYHIVAVLSGTNTYIYINGILVNSGSITTYTTYPTANTRTGANMESLTLAPNGTIDEVRIWNKALSPEEVKENYYRGAGSHNLSIPVNLQQNKSMLDDGLVLYQPFEENSGNKTYDYSNYGNTGTCYGVGGQVCNWTTGKFGTGLRFDGMDDYVNVSSTNFPTGNNSISGFAWIYIKSYENNGVSQQVFSYGTCCAVGSSTFDLFVYTNGQLYSSNWGNIGDVVPLNQWNFVGITYQANSTNATVYLNSQAYSTPNQQPLNISSNTMRIGLRVDGSYYFNGTIDEVRIYNRALSAEEIYQRYKLGQSKLEPVNYYYRNSTSDEVLWTAQNFKQAYRGSVSSPTGSEFSIAESSQNATNPAKITYNYNFSFSTNQKFLFALGYAKSQNTVNFSSWNGSRSLGFSGEDISQVGKSVLTYYDLKDDSIVGYWDFDDAGIYSGHNYSEIEKPGYVMDGSDFGNNGQLGNLTGNDSAEPSWTTGKFGGALQFDGVNDYVDAGTSAILSGTVYSVSAWFKTTATARGDIVTISAVSGGVLLELETSVLTAGDVSFNIGTGSGGNTVVSSGTLYKDGVWHHAVAVRNGVNLNLYVDGVLVASSTTAGATSYTADQTYIGIYELGTFNFNGTIDEVRIYKRALSADEIKAHYQSGLEGHNWGKFDNGAGTQHDAPASFYYGGVNDNSLVLGQTFDEGSGTTTKDFSPNANDGNISGATWTTSTPSGRGSALQFDGVDDYVAVPNSTSLNIATNTITIEAWIKRNRTGVLEHILGKSSSAENQGYTLSFRTTDVIDFAKRGVISVLSASTITDTNWHHITAVAGSTGMYLYIDGVLNANITNSDNILSDTNNLAIGAYNYGGTIKEYFNGSIDEVRIYNRSLSAAEIQMHYQSSLPKFVKQDGLSSGIGYADDFNVGINKFFGVENTTSNWSSPVDSSTVLAMKFEENSGNKTYDSSPYHNDGTCYGVGGQVCNWTSGKVGYGLQFDGVDDYVEIPNSASLNFTVTNQVTVSAWGKMSAGDDTLVSKGYQKFMLGYQTGDYPFFQLTINGIPEVRVTSSVVTDYTSWHFYVGTFDGQNLKIYHDGVLTGTTLSEGTMADAANNLWIGRNSFGGWGNGTIDEVRIYNRALSQGEIQAHYQQGLIANRSTGSRGQHKIISLNDFTPFNESVQSVAKFNLTDIDSSGLQDYDQRLLKITGVPTDLPNLTIITPANNSYVKTSSPELFANFSQVNFPVDMMWYSLDGQANYTTNAYLGYGNHTKLDLRFSEGSGNITYDRSGFGNNGTCYGSGGICNWTNSSGGILGYGLQFDGVDDYVQSTFTFQPTKFTVSWWIYPLNSKNYNQVIGAKGGQSGYGWGAFSFHTTDVGEVYVGTDVTTRFTPSGLPAGTLSLNMWQHFTFTFDNGEAKFYKNGVLRVSKTGMTNPIDWQGFDIGKNTADTINGTIDEVRILDRALTPDEIRQEYERGLGRLNLTLAAENYPDLQNYTKLLLHLNEYSGNKTYDNSLNSNDGTLLNFNDTRLLMHFEENSGNSTRDLSGFGNNGTCYGVGGQVCNWTSGKFGYGLQFDGVNDYVDAGNGASLNITNAITIEAWIYPKTITDYKGIVVKRSTSSDLSYALIVLANNKIRWAIKDSGGTERLVDTATNSINLNSWSHVTGTWEGGTMKVFINSVQDPTTATATSISTSVASVTIGNHFETGNSYPFNGTIDEVAIYSRALSAEEIAYRYQLTAANKTGVIPAERTAGKFNTTGIYFNQPRDVVRISW